MLIKSNKIVCCIFASVLLFSSSSLTAQDKQYQLQQEISRDSLLTIAQTIIKSAKSRTFITVDENGKPQARTMYVFPPEENMVVWLGTSTRSRKVKQIKIIPM